MILDTRATIQPCSTFIEVRCPKSHKLVCEFNPVTNEVRVVKRNGSTLIAVLPLAKETRS